MCGELGDSSVVVGDGEMEGLRRSLERNRKFCALRRWRSWS